MESTTKSDILYNAFIMSGIEPKLFVSQLQTIINNPVTKANLSPKEQFERNLFNMYAKRLALLLAS